MWYRGTVTDRGVASMLRPTVWASHTHRGSIMFDDASDFHPTIVDEFRRGPLPGSQRDANEKRHTGPMLLSIFGATLFAAIAVALVGAFGG